MALTVLTENTTTTDGTTQTLATDTTSCVMVFGIDTGAMVNGDAVEVTIKTTMRTAGTSRVAYSAIYANAQGQPQKYSVPVPTDVSLVVTLKRLAGTDRAFPWKLLRL